VCCRAHLPPHLCCSWGAPRAPLVMPPHIRLRDGGAAAQAPGASGLRRAAWLLALVSLAYCAAEGGASVAFASLDRQLSLMIFGVDSLVEVVSASLVLWRLLGRAADVRRERAATLAAGGLLFLLACAATAASAVVLVRREHPETTLFGIIISCITAVLLTGLWLAKRAVARRLDSQILASDATCSSACARLALVLLLGSVLFRVWPGGWWVDAAAALVLSLFFLREGVQMIRHAASPGFSGGCSCA